MELHIENADLLTEIIGIFIKLYQDDRALLTENKEYTFDLINTVLTLALKSQSVHTVISYIRFLAILCSCGEDVIPENQTFICDILLDKYSKLIIPTKVNIISFFSLMIYLKKIFCFSLKIIKLVF